uniref:Uncharacterized protein n=1 Tax=Rhizophora mucronata TaxID=61149 RepID=A0A2P2JHJ2_RHIMU
MFLFYSKEPQPPEARQELLVLEQNLRHIRETNINYKEDLNLTCFSHFETKPNPDFESIDNNRPSISRFINGPTGTNE